MRTTIYFKALIMTLTFVIGFGINIYAQTPPAQLGFIDEAAIKATIAQNAPELQNALKDRISVRNIFGKRFIVNDGLLNKIAEGDEPVECFNIDYFCTIDLESEETIFNTICYTFVADIRQQISSGKRTISLADNPERIFYEYDYSSGDYLDVINNAVSVQGVVGDYNAIYLPLAANMQEGEYVALLNGLYWFKPGIVYKSKTTYVVEGKEFSCEGTFEMAYQNAPEGWFEDTAVENIAAGGINALGAAQSVKIIADKPADYAVFDIAGRQVAGGKISAGEKIVQLESGAYIAKIKIKTEGNQIIKKIIVK